MIAKKTKANTINQLKDNKFDLKFKTSKLSLNKISTIIISFTSLWLDILIRKKKDCFVPTFKILRTVVNIWHT